MFDPSLTTILLLVVAAFGAGFIDAIAGGGGLITVPALMLAGLPPAEVLGTNKLQSLFGSSSATIAYAAQGHLDVRREAPMAFVSMLGGAAGAFLASHLPGDLLRVALPCILVLIALYFAFKPNIGDVDRARRISHFAFGATVVPVIGFYDGVFGPGTGSFFMLAFVSLAGFGLLKATANTKLLNFASNIGGFATFAVVGAIAWKTGLLMGCAQFIGARLGANLTMRSGARLIKPLLVTVCIALAIRLLVDQIPSLREWISL